MRVLSIQSHVVSGLVGNKIAILPMQLILNCVVDSINTVQLSNHTGFPKVYGQRTSATEFKQLIQGLEENQLVHKYSHVLSGYVGDPKVLQEIENVVDKVKFYLCDPVLGDHGKYYVNDLCTDVYVHQLLPHANAVTPNLFEAECLVGFTIDNITDASKACNCLHAIGPDIVVITSMEFMDTSSIQILASWRENQDEVVQFVFQVEKYSGKYTGTGDLFSALMLSWLAKSTSVYESVRNTIGTMTAIMKATQVNCINHTNFQELNIMECLPRVTTPFVDEIVPVHTSGVIKYVLLDNAIKHIQEYEKTLGDAYPKLTITVNNVTVDYKKLCNPWNVLFVVSSMNASVVMEAQRLGMKVVCGSSEDIVNMLA